MELTLNSLLTATKGNLIKGSDMVFSGVSIDSRTIKRGEAFFAIRGDRFDGHDFIGDALHNGASVIMLEKMPTTIPSELIQDRALVMVNDTRKALGSLASFWIQGHKIKVIAISGSCGKTTTKEMVSSILSSYRILKTQGNLNNDIGLPMTIFRTKEGHELAVLELGISKKGEMAGLVDMIHPDIALITNIGRGHLAGFGDLNTVSQEKAELFRGLKSKGTAIVNMDDPLIMEVAKGTNARKITYGTDKSADVALKSYTIRGHKGIDFNVSVMGKEREAKLNLVGVHNLTNALSAIAVALSLDVNWEDVRAGLADFVPPGGRMQMISLRNGIKVIDDTYNANPTSMEVSLKTLAQVKGKEKGIAVLGDMLELGKESDKAHREIGILAADLGIDQLFYMGRYGDAVAKGALLRGMNGGRVRCTDRKEDILPELIDMVRGGEWILIKGSRGMEMESIVSDLKDYFKDLKEYFH
ncbi:MAG: UDP-N-acetylmuramoyl-tripeptide--D-alanyl-D-alanine ligase [Thermodesulfobacteriota bacterium]